MISEIQEITLFYDRRKLVIEVMITAGPKPGEYQQYYFGNLGRKLTEAESFWLVQQIKDWLAIEAENKVI
jgi:hypothetical protein